MCCVSLCSSHISPTLSWLRGLCALMNQRPLLFRSEGRSQTKGTKKMQKIKIQRPLFHCLFDWNAHSGELWLVCKAYFQDVKILKVSESFFYLVYRENSSFSYKVSKRKPLTLSKFWSKWQYNIFTTCVVYKVKRYLKIWP